MACAALGAPTLASSPAEADPPRTARAVHFGAGFRYGVSMDDPFLDPWGSGRGLELGYTTQDTLYFGGGVRLLLRRESHSPRDEGGSEPVASGGGGRLRPPAERRGARATVDCDECIGAGTETKLAAAPGLTTMFFPGKLVLSIDARYQMVFADEMLSALIFSFGIGF